MTYNHLTQIQQEHFRRQTDPLGHAVTYTYDSLNRETSVTDPLNHHTTFSYDDNGNLTAVIDPLGHATTYAYDARNREVSETDPSGGGTTTLTYDAANNLTSLTDPDGNTTSYAYDSTNRVTTVTDPLGHNTTYTYDRMDNLTGKTDRDGRIYQYAYDADDKETTEKWIPVGGGAAFNTITHTYDAAERLTQVQDAHGKDAYTYDNANRLITVDDSGTTGLPQVTLTYGYDNKGNETSVDDGLGGLTSYTYDSRDRVVSITQSGTGVAAKRVDLAYDNAQRLTTITRYSNLAGSSKVMTTGYSYDNANRITGIADKNSSGATVVSYAYVYDNANRAVTEVRNWATGGSTDTLGYSYTNNNQLTGVTHTNGAFTGETFSFDANGNRNSTGYVTGTDNRLATDGTYTYAYDDEGNLTSQTQISTGDETVYTYDYHNRLVEADSVVGGVTTVLATFTYDAQDRRIGRKEGSTTTWTVYDGGKPVLDFDGSGTQVARYLQGIGAVVDQVLAREVSGSVAWYMPDRLGTVRDLVDNSGTVIDHVDYGVYGTVLSESAPATGDRLVGFAGLERDAATDLNLAVYRVLLSPAGVWTSEDPLNFDSGDANLFRYINNSPSNSIDPFGLAEFPKQSPDGHNGKNDNNGWANSSNPLWNYYQNLFQLTDDQIKAHCDDLKHLIDQMKRRLQKRIDEQKAGYGGGSRLRHQPPIDLEARLLQELIDRVNPICNPGSGGKPKPAVPTGPSISAPNPNLPGAGQTTNPMPPWLQPTSPGFFLPYIPEPDGNPVRGPGPRGPRIPRVPPRRTGQPIRGPVPVR